MNLSDEAITDLLALHPRLEMPAKQQSREPSSNYCRTCWNSEKGGLQEWPCPTVAYLEGLMEEEKYPALLGVSCDWYNGEDECSQYFEADIVVSDSYTQEQRFAAIIRIAVENGWSSIGAENPLTGLTFCPDHKVEAEQNRAASQ